MEISLTSLGSSQTLFLPHRKTEAARRFCNFRETIVGDAYRYGDAPYLCSCKIDSWGRIDFLPTATLLLNAKLDQARSKFPDECLRFWCAVEQRWYRPAGVRDSQGQCNRALIWIYS